MFWKKNLKHTPQSALVLKKIQFKVLRYNQRDFICQRPGLIKDQIDIFKTCY